MPLKIVIDMPINGCQYRACSLLPQVEGMSRHFSRSFLRTAFDR
jgi:hypothetical protein